MKNSTLLLTIALFFSLFILSSCENGGEDKGEVSTVNVVFKALYNGQPLQMNERYDYNGKDIAFSNLRFYLSDLVLLKGNLEANIKEIEMIDFTSANTNIINAAEGIRVSNTSMPLDIYDGLKFGIGVPSDLNAENPTDFSSNHPLGANGEYWLNWDSYIFHKLEGRYDNDSDPSDLESSFVYHVGIDNNYRTRVFSNLEIQISANNTTEIVVELEVSDLLKETDGSLFDIEEIGNIHTSEGDGLYPGIIADNWLNGFSL